MRPRVTKSEDGYSLWGLEPPDLAPQARKLFWGWVVEFGLKEKDRDLARGLDKDGLPFIPISEYTKKNRRSAMTPSGRGDPNAPPLTPGWQKSRTRSLLEGKAFVDHAEFWWRYDPHTGDSWARILEIQAEHGRDAFGLGKKAIQRVINAAWGRWEKYKAGKFTPREEPTEFAPLKPLRVGRYDQEFAIGMGHKSEIAKGQHAGFMTMEEWTHYFRQTAKVRIPGKAARPKSKHPIAGPNYNRMLRHVWQKRVEPVKRKRIDLKPLGGWFK